MTSLNVKSGGAWVPIADGKLGVKSGGVLIKPSKASVKYSGAWLNTGYDGVPAPPTGFSVNAWSYTTLSMKWVAGVGGAAVSGYDIQLKNQANTVVLTTLSDTASPSANFAITEDTKYNLYIRSKTASGLISAWVGPVKVAIGHAAYTTTSTAPATRAYSLAKAVTGYKDAAVGPTIPTTVDVQSIRYQISNTFSGVLSPFGTHSISRWGNGAEKEQFSWLSASIDTTVNVTDYTSNGGVQGLICRGTGWSSSPSGSFVCTGTITVNGLEHYTATTVTNHPAVANALW